jgi:MFS family permease
MNKNNPFLELFRNHNFLNIWSSQILSQVTIFLVNFLIILRIFEVTRSSVAVSLVWVFYAMPAIILGPFAGTITDTISKRKILILTTFIEGIAVLGYLLVRERTWPIYTIIFIYSLVNQLYTPAEASTLPAVVSKKLLPIANSLFLFTVYGAMLVGFGLSGPLTRLVGQEWPFVIAASLLFLASYFVSKLPKDGDGELGDLSDFWIRAKEGYIYIKERPLVLFPLLLLVGAQVFASVITVIAPSYATEALHLDLRDAGPIFVVPLAIGAVFAAYIINRFLITKFRKKRIISFGLLIGSIGFLVLGFLVPFLGSLKIIIAEIAILLLGVSLVSILIPVQTLIQETTPEEFRGRVFGVLGFTITLASVLPVLLVAAIADVLGANIVMGIIGIAVVIITYYARKELYEIYTYHRS